MHLSYQDFSRYFAGHVRLLSRPSRLVCASSTKWKESLRLLQELARTRKYQPPSAASRSWGACHIERRNGPAFTAFVVTMLSLCSFCHISFSRLFLPQTYLASHDSHTRIAVSALDPGALFSRVRLFRPESAGYKNSTLPPIVNRVLLYFLHLILTSGSTRRVNASTH